MRKSQKAVGRRAIRNGNKKILLRTLADTKRLAHTIAAGLHGGEVIGLVGPLGAGKTTLVQYLAATLGVKHRVRSPSFIVLQVFPFTTKSLKLKARLLCHVDAYRLTTAEELAAIGFHDYAGDLSTITVVEWAEKVGDALPPATLWIHLTNNRGMHAATVPYDLVAV